MSLVLVGLFIVRERRAAEPVLPLRLFRNAIVSVTSGAAFIIGVIKYGVIIFVPLYLQVVNGATPTRSGLLLTPLILGLIVGSVGSGRLITRWGRYKVLPVTGMAVATFGLYLLSRFDAHTGRLTQSLYMAVVGLGIGLVLQVLVLAVQNSVDQRDLGTAASANTFFRSMGGAFGVAIFGSIFNSRLNHYLGELLPSGVHIDVAAVQGGPEPLAGLPPLSTRLSSTPSHVPCTSRSSGASRWPPSASSSCCSYAKNPSRNLPTSDSKQSEKTLAPPS